MQWGEGKAERFTRLIDAPSVWGDNAQGVTSADERQVVLKDGSSQECINRFCYLGDMLGAAGGCGEASRTRVRGAWGQFKEFASVLTRRGITLSRRVGYTEHVYRVCWCMQVRPGQ